MSGTVFVSFVQDRHADAAIQVFTEEDAAIEFTRRMFRSVVAYPDHITEIEVPGYLLSLEYDPESDHAFVIERGIWEADGEDPSDPHGTQRR